MKHSIVVHSVHVSHRLDCDFTEKSIVLNSQNAPNIYTIVFLTVFSVNYS
jgi:hypothetical protein